MARLKLSAATLGTAAQLFAAARDMWNPLSSPPRITRCMHHDVSPSTFCDHWRASTLASMRQHSTCISWPRHHTCVPGHFNLRLPPPPPHCIPASHSPQRLSSNLQGCPLSARLFATLSSLACSQLRVLIDIYNPDIGQYDKFSGRYWILPISQLSPYWLLAIFIDTSDVAFLCHPKPYFESGFCS